MVVRTTTIIKLRIRQERDCANCVGVGTAAQRKAYAALTEFLAAGENFKRRGSTDKALDRLINAASKLDITTMCGL